MNQKLTILFYFFVFNAYSQHFNGPYINMDYHPNVKTVQIYPSYGTPNDIIKTPVKPLNSNAPLLLEFDVLGETQHRLVAEIIHLNNEWWKSNRVENEYLNNFNEFPIMDMEPSFNTKIDYVHYKLALPKVLLSGNYLISIYKEDNPNEVFLTRRFIIFEDLIQIQEDENAYKGSPNDPFQYVNFKVNYESLNGFNSAQDFYTVVRKNGSFQQERKGVKPTFIDQGQRIITYNLIDETTRFLGGNQFRTFDIRSTLNAGINVAIMDDTSDINTATLLTDEPRSNKPLTSLNDINGMYRIDHYENGDGDLNSDYIHTYFILKANKAIVGDIYVHGALSDWTIKKEFKMIYDEENSIYYCRPLLKQGYYNYEYILAADLKNIDYAAIEGSYNLTENTYEIFVYTKKPGTLNERLVGYQVLKFNATR